MVAFSRFSLGIAPSTSVPRWTSFFLVFWLWASSVLGEEISHFKSVGGIQLYPNGLHTNPTLQRPDLYPPVFTLDIQVSQRLSPGYIFLGPYEAENPGPYIYDNDGVRAGRTANSHHN